MDFILFAAMSLLITYLRYLIVLIFPYIGVKYHLECDMVGLKYLPLDTRSSGSITCPSMFLFYLRVYGEDVNSTT